MDQRRWGVARGLFDMAADLPPAEWDSWLLRECEDVELRAEVRAMLEADQECSGSKLLPGRVSDFIARYAPRASPKRPAAG